MTLYKVIIVDDEAVVRGGLKNTIRWEEHGFELVGDYANGRDAWHAIEREQPDLVISDISMPYMDGLELAGLITASYPEVKVIILTGYDEFEYAQQALRLKVSDFLLKPITAMEIRTLLNKVRAEMDEEMKIREDLSMLQSQLRQSMPLLRERLLERLVTLGVGKPEIEVRFGYFDIPKLTPPYLVLVADIDDFGDRERLESVHDEEFLRFAAFNVFEEITALKKALSFRTREERMAAVITGVPPEINIYEHAYELAEELRRQIEKYLKLTVTVGVGRSVSSADQLPLSYKSALSALDYRFLLGKNRVLGILDMEGAPASTTIPTPDWDRKLATVVKTGSAADAQELIKQIVDELKRLRLPIESCYLQLQKLTLSLMNTVQELGIQEKGLANQQQSWMIDIYGFKTLDELEQWLQTIVSSLITAISANRSHYTNTQMVRATEYIEANYADEQISLQDLCRHVLMSTSYFSLVFKQYTGETFVEYLTRVRVEKAKVLLSTTSLKLYEIAEKVGYADPNYFSLLFKKHAGRTPREYRDTQSGG
ncbi:two-component system response regulator YesN [Paenibacillus taihuensis]|uniref:Two-component system response regulator YesN n=1 Tax=Paenibacillus taihuensis TaxID=1156355 RepID=A0A3D9QV02_9BACL|nr:two-component system response regulator YesN [Paenibacillus taihuensis]